MRMGKGERQGDKERQRHGEEKQNSSGGAGARNMPPGAHLVANLTRWLFGSVRALKGCVEEPPCKSLVWRASPHATLSRFARHGRPFQSRQLGGLLPVEIGHQSHRRARGGDRGGIRCLCWRYVC